MLLAFDIGNTSIHLGLFAGDVLRTQMRIPTHPHPSSEDYAAFILPLLRQENISPADISDAIASCVVPAVLPEIHAFCARELGTKLLVAGETNFNYGIEIKTDARKPVGTDRLVNACAAWQRFRQPLIVVDMGTATTFDAVDHNGAFLGGAIAPGIQTALAGLQHKAAFVFSSPPLAAPLKIIGTNTHDALQSGLYYGYLGLVDELICQITRELVALIPTQTPIKTIATGGLAGVYAKVDTLFDVIDQDLTLFGLQHLHKLNS